MTVAALQFHNYGIHMRKLSEYVVQIRWGISRQQLEVVLLVLQFQDLSKWRNERSIPEQG